MIDSLRSTVLVADDDPDIRKLLTRTLERAGYSVLAAADGDTAFNLASEYHPVLAVLDVMMPGRSGLELVRDLRNLTHTRAMPIILASALAKETDVLLGLQAGADRYLAKPLSPRELVRCIRELLGVAQKQTAWAT
jgi:DNA-binding response OmpR family regulator